MSGEAVAEAVGPSHSFSNEVGDDASGGSPAGFFVFLGFHLVHLAIPSMLSSRYGLKNKIQRPSSWWQQRQVFAGCS